MTAPPNLSIEMSAVSFRDVRKSRRRLCILAARAVDEAAAKLRAKGFQPLTAVDDISVGGTFKGGWFPVLAKGLVRGCRRNGISLVGGEMAQMPGTYRAGAAHLIVAVVGINYTS